MNGETEQIFILNPSNDQSSSDQQKLVEISESAQINLENVEDFNNVCRICATVTDCVIFIFSGEGLQNNLAEKIHKHLHIKVSEGDELPRAVCAACVAVLLDWDRLLQRAKCADYALRAHLHAQTHKRTVSDTPVVKDDRGTEAEHCNELNTGESFFENETEERRIKNPDGESYGSEPRYDHDFSADDDDEPLSAIATKKSQSLYTDFYRALVNFRNHFATNHKSRQTYPDFTDSSDSEVREASNNDEETLNDYGRETCSRVDGYDDLTLSNMRKDRMDDETRSELSQVQRKIDGKVYYTCRLCDKNLSSTHTYLFHKRIHTGERPCVCHVCGKQFRAPNGLQRHLTETHERLRRYSCRLCTKTFANSQNMKQHMRIHTGERPFGCAQCGKRFTQSGSLHVHLKTHSGHFPHQCAECGAKFRLRAGLARHRLVHSGERPHACALCPRAFRQRHELAAHAASHSDAKPHACLVCGLAFKHRRALRLHAKRTHENDRPSHQPGYGPSGPYQWHRCPEGRRSIRPGDPSDRNSITDHPEESEPSEGVQRKLVKCEHCNRSVSTSSWRRHARRHEGGARRYSCATCGVGFNDGANLARHTRALHAGLPRRPHRCPACPKAFARKDHLQEHVRTHSAERPFVCDVCGKASKSGAALRMHRRTHSERTVPCVQCGAMFKRRGELRAHASVHSGERAHMCTCGRTFRLRAQLTAHARVHKHLL